MLQPMQCMLPEPGDSDKAQSAQLCARIKTRARRGALGFDEFMQAALYAPKLGYYASGRARFDAHGDFVTAPQLGNVTARCLAVQCAEVFNEIGDGDVLEFGAGSGQLAADMLTALDDLNARPRNYCIVETSAALRARQIDTIARHGLRGRVRWLARAPEKFCGFAFANEVLDALPVCRFEMNAHGCAHELNVGLDDNDRFVWTRGDLLPARLQKRFHECNLAEGYRGEIGLHGEEWVADLCARLRRGVILFLDYGFPRREFYHHDRVDGTLMCHYRHRAHSDPFFYPGLQDISAHVDFTAVTEAALRAKVTPAGFASQGAFLLSLGALDVLAEMMKSVDVKKRVALSREVQTLTMPQEMGELFKVIAFSRNCPATLRGFALRDRRESL